MSGGGGYPKQPAYPTQQPYPTQPQQSYPAQTQQLPAQPNTYPGQVYPPASQGKQLASFTV